MASGGLAGPIFSGGELPGSAQRNPPPYDKSVKTSGRSWRFWAFTDILPKRYLTHLTHSAALPLN